MRFEEPGILDATAPAEAMSRRLPPYRPSPLARDPLHRALEQLDDEDLTKALSPAGVSTRLPVAYPRSRADAETRVIRASVEVPEDDDDEELLTPIEEEDLLTHLVPPKVSEEEPATRAFFTAPVMPPSASAAPAPTSSTFEARTEHFSPTPRAPAPVSRRERPSAPPFKARQRRSTSVSVASTPPGHTPPPRHVHTQSRLSARSGPDDLFSEPSRRLLDSRPLGVTPPPMTPPPMSTPSRRGDARDLGYTPSAPFSTHPHPTSERPLSRDVSINNPWTFPTGAPPRSGTTTAKTARFGTKSHVIGASIVMLLSLGVLVASFLSVRSTARERAAQAASASITATGTPKAQATAVQPAPPSVSPPVATTVVGLPQVAPPGGAPAQPLAAPSIVAPAYATTAQAHPTNALHVAPPPVNASAQHTQAPGPAAPIAKAAAPAPRPTTPPLKKPREQATSLEQLMSDDMLK